VADPAPIEDDIIIDIEKKRRRRRKAQVSEEEDLEDEVPETPLPPTVDTLGIQPIPLPVAFDPESLPPGTFVDEPWDRYLPGPGFFRDFTYAMKGTESNTGFSMWSAAWAIATILTRHASLKWFPSALYPNFYVMFVAPPGICKKSTSAVFAAKIVKGVPKYFRERGDPLLAFTKTVPILDAKASTEALNLMLKPESQAFNVLKPDGSNHIVTIKKPSMFSICADELTTLLGNATYAVGIVDRLTSLYDGLDDSTSVTYSRGKEVLDDIYVNLLCATTPDSMRLTLPETAFGGGFMSRMIVVFSEVPFRIFSKPSFIEGTPTQADLIERLAWIAENCSGDYTFSSEAEEWFNEWYIKWKTSLVHGASADVKMTDYRFDTNIRKLAMLIRIQRYRVGNIIELEDLLAAKKILTYTYAFSSRATEEMGPEQVRFNNTIKRYIQKRGKVLRRILIQRMSARGCSAAVLDASLWQLINEELIKVLHEGKEVANVTPSGNDEYVWIGSRADSEEDEIDE
jgi:hypothetical protein